MPPDLVEVLLQVPGHRLVRAQHRQHVDEAEHLDLDGLVGHRPFEDVVQPPPSFKDRRPPPAELSPQFPANPLRFRFDSVLN